MKIEMSRRALLTASTGLLVAGAVPVSVAAATESSRKRCFIKCGKLGQVDLRPYYGGTANRSTT